ncbi:hypothetical protein HJFPF1_13576 [Paramyrothecium foliicola]|nr:hypothetical protein HJFPF1_13576 [Paramyrothecium foliicola]
MDDSQFAWMIEEDELDFSTPRLPTTPIARCSEPVDNGTRLPLLTHRDWDEGQQYDEQTPTCIHYDLRWKLPQRYDMDKRPKTLSKNSELNLVLAPSDFWPLKLQRKLNELVRRKLPGDNYTCEETNIIISIQRTPKQRLDQSFDELHIDWQIVDDHLRGVSHLFNQGKTITVDVEFVYKDKDLENAAATAKGKKKKGTSATATQRAEMEAQAGTYREVYKKLRCDAVHCKKGPHCVVDPRGNHLEVLPIYLEKIVEYVQGGGSLESHDEIPAGIMEEIKRYNQKRKAESLANSRPCKAHCGTACATGPQETIYAETPLRFQGTSDAALASYEEWSLKQVNDEGWKSNIRLGFQVAHQECLDLHFVRKNPKLVVDILVKCGVKPGIAGQLAVNVDRWDKEVEMEG